MKVTYEIQMLNGFGEWRRWSSKSTMEAAERSRARGVAWLVAGLVPESKARNSVRIVARGL